MINGVCVQVMHENCSAFKMDFPTTGEQLIQVFQYYMGWWQRWREWLALLSPGNSVLLSLGQGEPSSRLQMRHLPDQTFIPKISWLDHLICLAPNPLYMSRLQQCNWVLSSLTGCPQLFPVSVPVQSRTYVMLLWLESPIDGWRQQTYWCFYWLYIPATFINIVFLPGCDSVEKLQDCYAAIRISR